MREREKASINQIFDMSTCMDWMPINWDEVWAWDKEDQKFSLHTFNIKVCFKHLGSLIHKSGFQGRSLEIRICELEEMNCYLEPED